MRRDIICVARDTDLRAQLARVLMARGFGVDLAESAQHARSTAAGKRFALALVAPDGLGPDFDAICTDLRRASAPVLLVGKPGAASNGAGAVIDASDTARLLAEIEAALGPAPERAQAKLRFAGYTFDPEGCTLLDAAGTDIPLRRSEYAMLRLFLERPGRVLSRDTLRAAIMGRNLEAEDRSVDMLVARLRRKIEADFKRPELIATVPGMGYKFTVKVVPCVNGPALPPNDAAPVRETPSSIDEASVPPEHPMPEPARSDRWQTALAAARASPRMMLAIALALLILPVGAWRLWPAATPVPAPAQRGMEVAVAVLPFANLSGDRTQDYFGPGVAANVETILATFPLLDVIPAARTQVDHARSVRDVGRELGARYVLHGGIVNAAGRVRVTAELTDVATGANVWADRYDEDGTSPVAVEEHVADRIYDSLAGLDGRVSHEVHRVSWAKSAPSLSEYDYFLRAFAELDKATAEASAVARAIALEGLRHFPNSALLLTKVAWTYLEEVLDLRSQDIAEDVRRASEYADRAAKVREKSRLSDWEHSWLMAVLYVYRDQDFAKAVWSAEAAVQLVPHDARSRSSLSVWLACAGRAEQAVEWAEFAVRRQPSAPTVYSGNLAFAYWAVGRYAEAVERALPAKDLSPDVLAASYVNLGLHDAARAVIADWQKADPHMSVARAAALTPCIEPVQRKYLADLRAAGLPEN